MSVAFVLSEEAVSGTGPVTFPGFPGVWVPGEPQEAASFVGAPGLEDEEAVAARLRECEHLIEVAPKARKAKGADE